MSVPSTSVVPRVVPPDRGSSAAWRLDLGGEAYAILELPPPLAGRLRLRLTPAERRVAGLIARGLSNAEIATRRRSAPRTVANQAASIFRKLGVRSRLELHALLARGERRRDAAQGRP